MAEVEMQWYVLRAVSGKEAKVKEYIDAEIKNGRLGGHVAQVLIPTERVVQIRIGNGVELTIQLLFVQAKSIEY